MNTELLLKVKKAILKCPSCFDMSVFVGGQTCGTVGCIAAHALHIAHSASLQEIGKLSNPAIARRATEVLHLDYDQQSRLFYKDEWPSSYRRAYNDVYYADVIDRKKMAKVAAERIDHFIATEGRE